MREMFVCRFFRSRRQQRGVKATRVILIVDQREGCKKQRTDLRPVCPHNCRPCYAMLFGQHLRLPLSNVYHDVTVNNVKEKVCKLISRGKRRCSSHPEHLGADRNSCSYPL